MKASVIASASRTISVISVASNRSIMGRVGVGDRAALHHQLEDVRLDEDLVRLGVPPRSLHLLKVVFQRVFKLDGLHGCGSEVRDVSAWTSSLSQPDHGTFGGGPAQPRITAYPPALLLAASRASSITSASMSPMCSPISRAVAPRSQPIAGAAAAASESAPVPPDPSPGMSPRFTSVRHFYRGLGGPPGGIRARGPSCSLVGHD